MKFRRAEIRDVVGHDDPSASRYGELHDVIVSFIRQVGPPGKVNLHPLTHAQEGREHFLALRPRERGFPEKVSSIQHVLALQEQRLANQRLQLSSQTRPNHSPVVARAAEQCAYQNVGIDDGPLQDR